MITLIKLLAASPQTVQNCPTGQSSAFDPKAKSECLTTLPQVVADNAALTDALKIIFGIAAGIALISLMIAAFNFATAATDTEKISRARKAVLFSLLGLVISLSAETIVLTLLDKI